MTDDLALFDLPAQPRPARPSRPSRVERGQPGGTYARAVVADVTVIDAERLCAAAVHVYDTAPTFTIPWLSDDQDLEESDEPETTERDMLARDPGSALSWLIQPIESHLLLDEAGAARTFSTELQVDDSAEVGLRARWTVMLKVEDVAAFRHVALQASPDADPAEVANSIAAAWNHAAEPYAPLRSIPGILWTPVDVRVEHIPATERWSRRQDRGRTGSGSPTPRPPAS